MTGIRDVAGYPVAPARRDLFRLGGAAGAGLVAGRLLTLAAAAAAPSGTTASVQPQPDPASFAGDRTTADIIVETLIAWQVPMIFGIGGEGIGPLL